MKNMFASMTILSILLGSMLTVVLPSYAQQAQDERVTTDKLLEILDNAGKSAEEAFSLAKSRGVSIPAQVEQKRLDGLAIAKEAVQLRDQGRLAEARQKVIQALQSIKDAMVNISPQLESSRTPAEAQAIKARQIESAAERLAEASKRMEEAVATAEKKGLNVSNVKAKLSETKALVEKVREQARAGRVDDAAKDLEASENAIGQSVAALRPAIDRNKRNQSMQYVEGIEERLDNATGVARSVLEGLLQRLPAPARQGIQTALQAISRAEERAKAKVAEAREMIQEGRVQDAMPKLGELRGEVAQVISEIKQRNPDLGSAIEKSDKNKVAIKVLEDRAEILREKGADTTSLKAKIDEAGNLMKDLVEKLKQQDTNAVNDIQRRIDSIVNEAKGLADQLERR
ncbi:MAG: hypothetical protein HYY67_05065 [Thaumarchaeota archaeon]|nr:hypothetical protein [Nitrososphaerota archaeon]